MRIPYSLCRTTAAVLAAGILAVLSIAAFGCSARPAGMESPAALSEAEKNKVIEIALDTPEAQQHLEEESSYTTDLVWVAIVWRGGEAAEIRYLPFENPQSDPNYRLVPEEAVWYPGATIRFGQPSSRVVQAAVDLETDQPVNVMSSPDLSSPDRFPTSPPPGN